MQTRDQQSCSVLFNQIKLFEVGKVASDCLAGGADVFADLFVGERTVDARSELGLLPLRTPLKQ